MLEETRKLIVDPFTKRSLTLSNFEIKGKHIIEGILKSENGNEYFIHNGIANFTDSKNTLYDDNDLLDMWKKLQQNGKIVYEKFPTLNCSVKKRNDVNKFKKFCSFYGTVLDIGSGIKIPSYLQQNKQIKLAIGIDPLVSLSEKELDDKIDLINALGEHLPFLNESFDFVSFATSFDHVIDPLVVLKETKRVLKKNGNLVFWSFDKTSSNLNLLSRGFRKIKGIQNSLFDKDDSSIIKNQNKFIETLDLPKNAEDKFHLRHFDLEKLNHLCEKSGFKKKRIQKYTGGSAFIEYKLEK